MKTITQAEWKLYLKRLSRINEKAVEEFTARMWRKILVMGISPVIS